MFGRNARRSGNKYGNKKVEIDGIVFDSMIEGKRYQVLKEYLEQGLISELECHKTYELLPSQKKIVTETKVLKTKVKVVEKEKVIFKAIKFSPDFVYKNKDGEIVAEDVKGSKHIVSADFPLRQKLFYSKYGIYVNLVTKANAPLCGSI